MFTESVVTKLEAIILWGSMVLMGYALIVSVPTIKKNLILATTVQPETFTELYFADHLHLPKKSEQYLLYKVPFTIHNLENKDMVYPYTVSLQRDGYNMEVGHDTVTLKKGELKTIDTVIGPLNDLPKKVVIKLTNQNQIISFWMNKP